MQILKRRRLEKRLTLRQLAEQAGVPRTTLWRIEQGMGLPDPAVAANLRKLLDLPGLPDSAQILSTKAGEGLAPFDFARPNQSNWERMASIFAYQLRQLRVPQSMLDWMRECFPSDSPRECLALCSLAAEGATGQFSNPHRLGYRQTSIIDEEGRALGERVLPGLQWMVDGVPVLLWPQIRVLTAYGVFRSDLLISVGGQWPTAEIDSKSPVPEYERYRSAALGGEPLRYTNEDVRQLRFASMLRQALEQKLLTLVAPQTIRPAPPVG